MREELLFLAAMLLAAYAVQQRIDDGLLDDVRVWALMLTVQSIPYAAAVLVSPDQVPYRASPDA